MQAFTPLMDACSWILDLTFLSRSLWPFEFYDLQLYLALK